MAEQDQDYTFRDNLSTITEEGNRSWVYCKKPSGKYYKYRSVLASFLLLLFFTGPFITIDGDPLLLLNFVERKFIFFGIIFWPQDFHLFVLSMITSIVFIVLFTVIFGRIFCGWICPQTIFMEFVFRQLEYLIEGNNSQQRKLDDQPWNAEKFFKKSIKHFIFFIISFLIANVFLSYLLSFQEVKGLYVDGLHAHLGGFIGLVIFSGVFYFVFAKFREQVCIIVCPYGRLQGVMLDRNSIIVSYDYKRGEPKGKYNPLEDRKNAGKGDCISCNSCVHVCPTGIDIRNGSQLECINCTACIDACDAVMTRINKRKGLIRYASERSIAEGTSLKLNARVVAYSIVLTGLLVLIGFLFTVRTSVEATVLRMPGTLFQQVDSAHYSNIYTLQVVNKTRKEIPVEIRLLSPEGELKRMGNVLVVKKGELGEASFLVVLAEELMEHKDNKVLFGIYNNGKLIEEAFSTFVGPEHVDKHKEKDNDHKDKDHEGKDQEKH